MKPERQRIWPQIVVPILSAVVAGALAYFFGANIEKQKRHLEDRKVGYEDLFKSTAIRLNAMKAGKLREGERGDEWDDKDMMEEFNSLRDTARFKIGVFGNADVVHGLANYWGRWHAPENACKAEAEDDIAIYQAMRRSVGAEGEVTDEDLAIVLFECRLEKQTPVRDKK